MFAYYPGRGVKMCSRTPVHYSPADLWHTKKTPESSVSTIQKILSSPPTLRIPRYPVFSSSSLKRNHDAKESHVSETNSSAVAISQRKSKGRNIKCLSLSWSFHPPTRSWVHDPQPSQQDNRHQLWAKAAVRFALKPQPSREMKLKGKTLPGHLSKGGKHCDRVF